jgi:flagellar FliL protein
MSTATANRPAVAGAGGQDGTPAPGGGRRKRIVLVAVVLVVLLAAGGWFFLLRDGGSGAEAEPAPTPGEVLALDSISVNLAGGHYLKLGLALQMVEGAAHAPDGSRALDIAIDLFSGRDMVDLASTEQRQEVKAELVKRIAEAYHDEVMDVYFTEFVMQ